MAAGDAQRVWYPEMLAELKQYWSAGIPWDEVIAFCERMTVMRKELAMSKDIKPPMITCHKCGTRARAAYPTISVRSLIFALHKIGAVSPEEVKEMDRDWKRHQRKNRLDGYGRSKSEPSSPT
jgi:hypothetical protein